MFLFVFSHLFFSLGSVFSLLDNYFKEGLDEITVASIASQVVTALAYIHSQGMICQYDDHVDTTT